MTIQEEEQYLKEQAELVCNSIAFWESKIGEFSASQDNQVGGALEPEETLTWFDEEEEEEQEENVPKELVYLVGHLQFDLREMERLEQRCKAFALKHKNGDN